MKTILFAGLACCLTLCACESTFETYDLGSDTVANHQGVLVTVHYMEPFSGNRYSQYRAQNNNDFPVCVQLTMNGYANSYSFGGPHKIQPYSSADIGYAEDPSNYYVDVSVYGANEYDQCDL